MPPRLLVAAGAIAVLLAPIGRVAGQAPGERKDAGVPWIVSWAASPQPWLPPVEQRDTRQPQLDRFTVRQSLRLSAGGAAMRVRLSNETGRSPLKLSAVRIARPSRPDGREIDGASERALLFAGRGDVVLPPGATITSDPLALDLPPLAEVVVSMDVVAAPRPATAHLFADRGVFVSRTFTADATDLAWLVADTITVRPFLVGLEVRRRGGRTLVCFGDSLTDGVGSTFAADRRWPDDLAERLQREGLANVGVANAGIAGNRLLVDRTGPSARARFGRDVLAVPGASLVVLFEGINDIGTMSGAGSGPVARAATSKTRRTGGKAARRPGAAGMTVAIIAADKRMAQRARAAGIASVAVTLTPFRGHAYFTPEREAARQAVNAWMRASHDFDAVLDADMLLRDPQRPEQLDPSYDLGDHLHGNDEAYRRLAEAFPIERFAAALK